MIDEMQEADWPSVRAIYAAGLATGNATFETDLPDWPAWDAAHLPICRLVTRQAGRVTGWAALNRVSARQVYVGVAEVSIYVAEHARGQGTGRLLLHTLIEESERAGFWMLQTSIFPENVASLRLHFACGFREVGRRERIGQRNGVWRDTVLLERRSALVGV